MSSVGYSATLAIDLMYARSGRGRAADSSSSRSHGYRVVALDVLDQIQAFRGELTATLEAASIQPWVAYLARGELAERDAEVTWPDANRTHLLK